jgi:hypothetical protein
MAWDDVRARMAFNATMLSDHISATATNAMWCEEDIHLERQCTSRSTPFQSSSFAFHITFACSHLSSLNLLF